MPVYTYSELEAFSLVYKDRLVSTNVHDEQIRKASDYIVELAERIKNDKLTIAMQGV